MWDGFGLEFWTGAGDCFLGCPLKTLHRTFPSHLLSLRVCTYGATYNKHFHLWLPKLNPLLLHQSCWKSVICTHNEPLGAYIGVFHTEGDNHRRRLFQTTLVCPRHNGWVAWSRVGWQPRSSVFRECLGTPPHWSWGINLDCCLSTSSQEIAIGLISLRWLICTVIIAGKYWSRKSKHIIHLNLQSRALTWQFTIYNMQVYF